MAKIRESDFFRQTIIFLTKKHRNKLKELKDMIILRNNVTVDNSTFARALIDYLYDNPDICGNLKNYIIQNKGATYVTKFEVAIEEGKNPSQIAEILGLDKKLVDKIIGRLNE